jgi:serine/threonine-protein kinase
MRYREAKAIVHQALDLPIEQRHGFIDRCCEDDEPLRQEALWLLQTMEDADRFLEDDPLRQAEPEANEVVKVSTPRDYRIVRRLGEGGHGVVFLAERSDGRLRQLVALKLLNFAGQLSPSATARFLDEGRILARLNHPYIAHLVDGGALPDGRPFLAMEFVDGTPVTSYCDHHALDVDQRVRLFLKICAATSYAHQQLVIHRDLKPGNILVTQDGKPKLLDFGIARLLTTDEDVAAPITDHGRRLLTLVYASPEQIRGESLTTASDIYSLGVLLYELLTGATPFIKGVDDLELTRTICESEPERPSRRSGRTRTSVTRTGADTRSDGLLRWSTGRRWISSDLDAITLKALRKRPEERYGSVHELADDLKRYLTNRPVRAKKGRFVYYAHRYLQRNRWTVAASATFAAMVVGFAFNLQSQLERTKLERDKAQQLASFITGLFDKADPSQSRGESITVRELLDRGARELSGKQDIDPRLKASLLSSIGAAYTGLGLPKASLPLLTAASELERQPVERARTLRLLADANSADGNYMEAIVQYQRALDVLRTTTEAPEDLVLQIELETIHNRVQLANSPLDPLIAELKHKIRALESRANPPKDMLLQAYGTLGSAYNSSGNYPAAAAALGKAVPLSVEVYGALTPSTLAMRRCYAQAMVYLEPAKAVPLFESLASDYARMVGDAKTMLRASILGDLAVSLQRVGQDERSAAVTSAARDMARSVAAPTDRYYLHLTINLASQLNRLGREDEAVALLREILPALAERAHAGIDRLIYAHALASLGIALQDRDEVEAARAFAMAEQTLGADGPAGYFNVHEGILYRLTEARLKLKRYEEAESSLRRLKALEKKMHPGKPALRSRILEVDLMMAYGRYKDAEALSGEGLVIARTAEGECSTSAIRLRQQLDAALKHQGSAIPSEHAPDCSSGPKTAHDTA